MLHDNWKFSSVNWSSNTVPVPLHRSRQEGRVKIKSVCQWQKIWECHYCFIIVPSVGESSVPIYFPPGMGASL
jgi:hypothetical protein